MRRFIFAVIAVFSIFILACGGRAGNKIERGLPSSEGVSANVPMSAQVLSQIENLSAPVGVDKNVFDSLRRELKRQVEILGTAKNASAAPDGDYAKVTDLAFDFPSKELTWTYTNLGDYDRNGETAIPDITPIAIHYLADTDDGAGDDALEAWVDGDESGEVAISDITPIARNFLGEIANYRILTAINPNDEYQVIGVPVPFGTAGEFPKEWSVPLPNGVLNYVKVQPVGSDGSFGAASDALVIPQKADVLSVSPIEGYEFDQKTFAAAVTGTGPFTYSWDFKGGANPDTSTDANPTVTLAAYGTYECMLAVSSEFGGEYFPFTLTVKPLLGVLIVTPQGGSPEEQVQFKAVVKGGPTLYAWNFGAGATPRTSIDANPQVTFSAQEGEYEGSLTLYGRGSPVTYPFTYAIDAANEHPRFDYEHAGVGPDNTWSNRFINYPMAGQAPLTSTFDFSRAEDLDGTVTTYLADLDGDGLLDWFGTEPIVSETYDTPGFRLISGRVMDDKGFIADAERPVIAFETDPYEGAVPDSLFLMPDRWTYNVGDKMYLVYFNYLNANEIEEFFRTRTSVDISKAIPVGGWAGDLFNPFVTEDPRLAEFWYLIPGIIDENFFENRFFFGYINPDGVQQGIGAAIVCEIELLSQGTLELELLASEIEFDGTGYRRPSTDNWTTFSTLGKDYGSGVTAKITVNVN